jgi:dihydroorotase (multifunctional complex type)
MSVRFDLAIRGGTVVTAKGRAPLDLYTKEGRVAAVVSPTSGYDAAEVLDASGALVLPGMVDTHVHFMEPGDATREDFLEGSTAAAMQGVTTVVEHTHSWPVNSPGKLAEKLDLLRGRAAVDFGLAAHVWPERMADLPALWRAGITYFKAFTCNTHGVPAVHPDKLLELTEAIAPLGARCLVHCEDDLMTAANERLLRDAQRDDGAVIPEWRSREAELVATGTVALFSKLRGARFIIAHASNPEAIALIEAMRGQGAPILTECCPQYMRIREDEILSEGALRKFTPPARIRSSDDERRMWDAFNRGQVNHLASDHAPATREQKLAGDIWSAHFGLPGIDTTMPLMLDAALRGRTSLERVVEAYSAAPARTYGLHSKGSLDVGADADAILVDVSSKRELADEDVVSRAGWTPYAGTPVQGRVSATVLRGRVIVRDGRLEEPGRAGRFVPGAGYVASAA